MVNGALILSNVLALSASYILSYSSIKRTVNSHTWYFYPLRLSLSQQFKVQYTLQIHSAHYIIQIND